MNYRSMSLKDGSKILGWWGYALIELILLGSAILCIAKGDFLEAIAVFILIEIREINLKLKDG